MQVLFIGTSSVVPEAYRDTASYLINEEILIDCGWWAALGLRRYGLDPLAIRHLLVTHCHHDHYMGLPQLLYYKGHARPKSIKQTELGIWGPANEIEEITELAYNFLRGNQFPGIVGKIEVQPLIPGDIFEIGTIRVSTCASVHPVPGLCYRLDVPNKGAIVFSGDTAYNEALAELAEGADILIHEASYGASAPRDNPTGHSGGIQAAQIAKEADVKLLILVHATEDRRVEAVAAAETLFQNVRFAEEGERIYWRHYL